jgi:hypothetical protein
MMMLSVTHTVTLNLFQGPFGLSSSGRAARWMLKQVQHDDKLVSQNERIKKEL